MCARKISSIRLDFASDRCSVLFRTQRWNVSAAPGAPHPFCPVRRSLVSVVFCQVIYFLCSAYIMIVSVVILDWSEDPFIPSIRFVVVILVNVRANIFNSIDHYDLRGDLRATLSLWKWNYRQRAFNGIIFKKCNKPLCMKVAQWQKIRWVLLTSRGISDHIDSDQESS